MPTSSTKFHRVHVVRSRLPSFYLVHVARVVSTSFDYVHTLLTSRTMLVHKYEINLTRVKSLINNMFTLFGLRARLVHGASH